MRRLLGHTRIAVHPIGMGAMPLSIEGRPSERAALRVLRAALDHGIELIDTADSYCRDETEMGHNERLIGRIVRKHGNSNVVVATKGGVRRPSGRWVHDGRPEYLRRACEASLGALGVDRITLYQLHAVDHRVPFEDSIGALAELRAAGLIEHIGLSNVGVEQIERALAITPIASVQNRAGFYWRAGLTDGVLDLCERKNIAFMGPHRFKSYSRGFSVDRAHSFPFPGPAKSRA